MERTDRRADPARPEDTATGTGTARPAGTPRPDDTGTLTGTVTGGGEALRGEGPAEEFAAAGREGAAAGGGAGAVGHGRSWGSDEEVGRRGRGSGVVGAGDPAG
ncbi:hypothetical protein CXF35_06830 [Corynebacterium bovis]|uniref:hypothetical protein n=1 Tax=Corynebacterium bovis TaxID=36808 RepID=UPI000F64FB5D|nr:hypothetical protein [Corynebacterium bovis]RRQ13267.1 hypothetical protein CXF35_06830 [Corynebacterium bovis]